MKATNTFLNTSHSPGISSSSSTGPCAETPVLEETNLEFLWNFSKGKECHLLLLGIKEGKKCTQGKLHHFCDKLPARTRMLYWMETCSLAHKDPHEFVPPSLKCSSSLGPDSNQQRQLPFTDHDLKSKERWFCVPLSYKPLGGQMGLANFSPALVNLFFETSAKEDEQIHYFMFDIQCSKVIKWAWGVGHKGGGRSWGMAFPPDIFKETALFIPPLTPSVSYTPVETSQEKSFSLKIPHSLRNFQQIATFWHLFCWKISDQFCEYNITCAALK